jgi:hypothetical protein
MMPLNILSMFLENPKSPPLVWNCLPFGCWRCVAVFSTHLVKFPRCQAFGALNVFFSQNITIQCHDSTIPKRSASVYLPQGSPDGIRL